MFTDNNLKWKEYDATKGKHNKASFLKTCKEHDKRYERMLRIKKENKTQKSRQEIKTKNHYKNRSSTV